MALGLMLALTGGSAFAQEEPEAAPTAIAGEASAAPVDPARGSSCAILERRLLYDGVRRGELADLARVAAAAARRPGSRRQDPAELRVLRRMADRLRPGPAARQQGDVRVRAHWSFEGVEPALAAELAAEWSRSEKQARVSYLDERSFEGTLPEPIVSALDEGGRGATLECTTSAVDVCYFPREVTLLVTLPSGRRAEMRASFDL